VWILTFRRACYDRIRDCVRLSWTARSFPSLFIYRRVMLSGPPMLTRIRPMALSRPVSINIGSLSFSEIKWAIAGPDQHLSCPVGAPPPGHERVHEAWPEAHVRPMTLSSFVIWSTVKMWISILIALFHRSTHTVWISLVSPPLVGLIRHPSRLLRDVSHCASQVFRNRASPNHVPACSAIDADP
jgi:hypothetical protein